MEKVRLYVDRSLPYHDLIEKAGYESRTQLIEAILLFHEFYRIPYEVQMPSGFIEVGLIQFGNSVTTHEALGDIRNYGFPLTLFELITLSIYYPDFSIDSPVVGLGTTLFAQAPFTEFYKDKNKTRKYLIPRRLDIPWITTFRFAVNCSAPL